MINSMIAIKNVTKRYSNANDFSLRGINLNIKKGEFFGLLGPNGCGKTTLISILTGIIPASDGEVEVEGKNIKKDLKNIKPLIGYIPQEIALYPTLSICDNLKFFGRLYGLRGKLLKKRVNECVRIACLEQVAHTPIMNFSGGMTRRANLVLGLIHHPIIILLDEPTVNVDPQSRNVIFNILQELNRSGVTIIYTTHYLEEAEQMCSRVAIMNDGLVIAADTPQKLIAETPDAVDLGEVFLKLTGHHLRD